MTLLAFASFTTTGTRHVRICHYPVVRLLDIISVSLSSISEPSSYSHFYFCLPTLQTLFRAVPLVAYCSRSIPHCITAISSPCFYILWLGLFYLLVFPMTGYFSGGQLGLYNPLFSFRHRPASTIACSHLGSRWRLSRSSNLLIRPFFRPGCYCMEVALDARQGHIRSKSLRYSSNDWCEHVVSVILHLLLLYPTELHPFFILFIYCTRHIILYPCHPSNMHWTNLSTLHI